jgi:hypothetical protein
MSAAMSSSQTLAALVAESVATQATQAKNLPKMVYAAKKTAIEDLVKYLSEHLANEDTAVLQNMMTAIQNFYHYEIRLDGVGVAGVAADAVVAAAVADKDKDAGKKPPTKSKRAPNAYNIFMSEKMKQLKADHPEMDNSQLMTISLKAYKDAKALNEIQIAERKNKKRKTSGGAGAEVGSGGSGGSDIADVDPVLMAALESGDEEYL